MFGIKKKGRKQAERLHRLIGDNIAPFVVKVSNNLRLSGRKRLFRRWGRNNPKRVMSIYAAFAVAILAWNIIAIIGLRSVSHKDNDPLRLGTVTAVSNPFDGMTAINRNRETINDAISELAQANMRLAHRFDSLCNLRVKSREDSLEIVSIYNKFINKTDSNNEP